MGRRRKARESALQILFQLEFDATHVKKKIDQYWKAKKPSKGIKDYSTWLIKGISTHKKEIDNIIQATSDHWRISRMALVDRNILRIAVFEILYEKDIAPAIIINEAIEIAKRYSSEEAAAFVNGVLDAVKKKIIIQEDTLKDDKNG